MQDYDIVATLNNGAVSLIRHHGDGVDCYKEAVRLLRQAARTIRRIGAHRGYQSVQHSTEGSAHHALASLGGGLTSVAVEEDMFGEPIALLPTPAAYSIDPLVNAGVVSAIVIFNRAVVSQREFLRSSKHRCAESGVTTVSDTQANLLNKSQLLHQKIERILHTFSGSFLHPSGKTVLQFIAMATLNNVGQNAYLLSDFEKSRRSFMGLSQLANKLDPYAFETDLQTELLLDQVKERCMVNTAIVSLPTTSPAA